MTCRDVLNVFFIVLRLKGKTLKWHYTKRFLYIASEVTLGSQRYSVHQHHLYCVTNYTTMETCIANNALWYVGWAFNVLTHWMIIERNPAVRRSLLHSRLCYVEHGKVLICLLHRACLRTETLKNVQHLKYFNIKKLNERPLPRNIIRMSVEDLKESFIMISNDIWLLQSW